MKKQALFLPPIVGLLFVGLLIYSIPAKAQSRELTSGNIDKAIREASVNINSDPMCPAFHLTPPVGCMGDPNGGIYHDGWYHIFYGMGLQGKSLYRPKHLPGS